MSRDYINDPAEDAAFSLRRISSTLEDILETMQLAPPPPIPDAKVREAAILVVQMLEARIPQRGDEDDIGFEDEHAAIENLLAMFDVP
jgi:hypothetical protein